MSRVICRTAFDLSFFFFVQGATRANPAVSVPVAIADYCRLYNLAANREALKTKYYRILDEYRKEAAIAHENLNIGVNYD